MPLTVKAVCADGLRAFPPRPPFRPRAPFPDVAGALDIGSTTATCPAGRTMLGEGARIMSSNGAVSACHSIPAPMSRPGLSNPAILKGDGRLGHLRGLSVPPTCHPKGNPFESSSLRDIQS